MLSHTFVFIGTFCVKARKIIYLHQLNQQHSASLKEMNRKCETAISQQHFGMELKIDKNG